jgi:hypothetical protein
MRTLLVLVALAALAVPTQAAAPCYTTSTGNAESVVVSIPNAPPIVGGGGMYLVAIHHAGIVSCALCVDTYYETNGIPGLQRHDDVAGCADGTVADQGPGSA